MFEWLKKLFKKKEKVEVDEVLEEKTLEEITETIDQVFAKLDEEEGGGNADHLEGPLETGEEPAPESTPQIEPDEEVPVTEAPDEKTKKIIAMAIFYLNTEGATLQMVAKEYGVSSTTVSKYFSKLLPGIDTDLACKVKEKLEKAKAENVERLKASAKKAKK